MTIDPIPPIIYKRFAQTMAIFTEYLNGSTKVALAAKHGISMDTLDKICAAFGNCAYRCWEQAGMPEPKCTPHHYDQREVGRYYFNSLTQVRREKKFWLTQLERMQLLFDAQQGKKEKDKGQANLAALDLSMKTIACLQWGQIETIEALEALTVIDLKRMPGIGEISRKEIRDALRKYRGLDLPEVTEIKAIKDAGCFVGTLSNGMLDLLGAGEHKTVQLDGSFTQAQLECLIRHMKENK